MTLFRYPANPILTRDQIPVVNAATRDVSSVFNPGAITWRDKVHLLLRVQNRGRETLLMAAESRDGFRFEVHPHVVAFSGFEKVAATIYHVYDPRLTVLDGKVLITVALDTDTGCWIGLATTEDFQDYHWQGVIRSGDVRNAVLFPEKIGGRYTMLERPNLVQLESGPTSGEEIHLVQSDDLMLWQDVGAVLRGRPHYWDERIGSGPPPVKTREGWLHIYHGVATHFGSSNIYQAGALLLDLEDPRKVIARTRYNILEPRELYELTGQVPNVVFPSGMVVRDYDADGFAESDSEVLIYYGAADTSIGLATSTVQELIDSCFEGTDR